MAKQIKTQNFYDTVNELVSIAKEKGLVHLYTEDQTLNGRTLKLKNYQNELINFGSCSYLGLETDIRLVSSGIEHLKKYGSQFSSSRTYVSIGAYRELEELLLRIFKAPLLLAPSSTIGHLAVIPAIIQEHDAIIMDHQAHISMHHGTKLINTNVTIALLRHNRLDELEKKIEQLKDSHNRIWYFMDGIYSMYGDVAPAKSVIELLNKHPQLYLYVDDAHGMSWTGENGRGYFLNQIGSIHPKMILSTSLAKSFGSSGGVFVFPNEEWCTRVKTWGGPLTYSGPQQPATIGCSIASAKIHLSDEIVSKQLELKTKIKYCNELFKSLDLPLISYDEVPIKFVGLGTPKVGYNMIKRLMNDGFYTNLGIYPAVPENCTGIRFTLTNHLHLSDIERLANTISKHLPKVLQEEGRTYDDIIKPFKLLKRNKSDNSNSNNVKQYKLKRYRSITEIESKFWDNYFASDSICNAACLKLMEESFSNNEEKENNWEFYYYILSDNSENVIAITFFTLAMMKNDMLSDKNVSEEVERIRATDMYYQTSKCFTMGTLLTEGKHIWYNENFKEINSALTYLIDEINKDSLENDANLVFLRDFNADNQLWKDLSHQLGYIKVVLPCSHELPINNWETKEEFFKQLPQKKRNRLRKEVLANENEFEVVYRSVTERENYDIDFAYELYCNVNRSNLSVNTFLLPKKLFSYINKSEKVDVIELWMKVSNQDKPIKVAVGYCLVESENYFPWVLGLDYKYKQKGIYRQLLLKAVLRAKQLGCKKIHFGLTADEEKGKLNCKSISRVGFVQVRDDYDFSELHLITQKQLKM